MHSVQEVYLSRFGTPSRTARFVPADGGEIYVLKWDEDRLDEGVTMYCTAGASRWIGEAQKTCEFFIGISPAVDEIARAVAEVGRHGRGDGAIPVSGDSITLAGPLWNGTAMRTFMFTDGSELLEPVTIESRNTQFMQLVPLFDSELEFKRSKGEAALWNAFEMRRVRYWSSSRQPAF